MVPPLFKLFRRHWVQLSIHVGFPRAPRKFGLFPPVTNISVVFQSLDDNDSVSKGLAVTVARTKSFDAYECLSHLRVVCMTVNLAVLNSAFLGPLVPVFSIFFIRL